MYTVLCYRVTRMAGDRAPGLLCGDDDVAPAVIDRKAIGFRSYTRHKKKKKEGSRPRCYLPSSVISYLHSGFIQQSHHP